MSRQQAGILVGHVIALTPPGGKDGQSIGDSGGITLESKKRGEAAVASDISKLFPTSSMKHERLVGMVAKGFEFKTGKGHKDTVTQVAETMGDLARIHQAARDPKSGRTRKGKGSNMAISRKFLVRQYIKNQMAKVGKLNSGWISAAKDLHTASSNVPAWITRHGARNGGSNISDSGPKVIIQIFNNQRWFPQAMESRVKLAVARRERGLIKAIEAVMDRRAKAAEARMGH